MSATLPQAATTTPVRGVVGYGFMKMGVGPAARVCSHHAPVGVHAHDGTGAIGAWR
jgi:hypothetical protein